MPVILSLTFAVALIVAFLTLLFRPILSATTVLAIDSDLIKIVGTTGIPVPAITNNDYIRYEFFASHSVHLMQLPQIARIVINKDKLLDRSGDPLQPEYLVHPDIVRLIFNNNGLGVNVNWITDTQTFAIIGTSKDPDKAVQLSRDYAEAFLEENSNQYLDAISKLLERAKIEHQDAMRNIVDLDLQFKEVKTKFKSVEPTEDIKLVSQRIIAIRTLLEAAQLKGARYKTEIENLKQKAETFAKLKRVEKSISVNPTIDSIKSEIRQLAGSISAASVEYTPNHPEYKQAQRRLALAKEMLKKESLKRFSQETIREHPLLDTVTQSILDLTLENVTNEIQVQFFNDLIDGYEKRLNDLSMCSTLLQNLNFQRDALAATLQQSMKDQYRFESVLQKRVPFFRIVSAAHINNDNLGEYRYFPKRKRTVLLSALISAFLIFFFIVGRELKANFAYFCWQLDPGNKDIGCAEVPFMEPGATPVSGRDSMVCSRIQDLCASEKDAPLLRISSKYAGEGKATIALALAWYFKKTGTPFILVDGDTSGRSVSKVFGAGDRPGLADVRAGRLKIEDAILETASGTVMVPAGREVPTGEGAGDRSSLNEIISRLNSLYSRVIYLEPPFMDGYDVSTDTLPVHDVIMVAESGRHSVLALDEATAMRRFNSDDARLKWLVINKTPRVVDLFSPRDVYRSISELPGQLKSRFRR